MVGCGWGGVGCVLCLEMTICLYAVVCRVEISIRCYNAFLVMPDVLAGLALRAGRDKTTGSSCGRSPQEGLSAVEV